MTPDAPVADVPAGMGFWQKAITVIIVGARRAGWRYDGVDEHDAVAGAGE